MDIMRPKIVVFGSKAYDEKYLSDANSKYSFDLTFLEPRLDVSTASLAIGAEVVCCFVNDVLSAPVLKSLKDGGTNLITMRCAGYNNVDLASAKSLGLKVVRVPEYSPRGVAEHTIALLLTLVRKTHRAYNRVREGNFSLEGLLGIELYGKSVGIVGTGRIGSAVAQILAGFGCKLLGFDSFKNEACEKLGMVYVGWEELLSESTVISLHCPLTPQTYHLIDSSAIAKMQEGVTIINTSRGALIDAQAVIEGLKSKQVAGLGLDVYEEEAGLFFEDMSGEIIQDDVFSRLLTFPNVIITGHQAFFTTTALENIAATTLGNIDDYASGRPLKNEIPC
jgi:D-lactate dehydrogenase